MPPAASRPRLRATCCAAATYFRIRPAPPALAPSAYLTYRPPGAPKGHPPLNRNILARRDQARFPIRISQRGSDAGFSRPCVLPTIFHPRSDIPFGLAVSPSSIHPHPRERERKGEREKATPVPSSRRRHTVRPPGVCERFYDVCRPRGALLLFITTTVPLCDAPLTRSA